ncbi:hypothetical protein C8Q74DRAFT_1386006 [Fomes fomentarius]|nr:hypothetical protein C8Q74DRAFT_1386006 [Fomes fomentarius]
MYAKQQRPIATTLHWLFIRTLLIGWNTSSLYHPGADDAGLTRNFSIENMWCVLTCSPLSNLVARLSFQSMAPKEIIIGPLRATTLAPHGQRVSTQNGKNATRATDLEEAGSNDSESRHALLTQGYTEVGGRGDRGGGEIRGEGYCQAVQVDQWEHPSSECRTLDVTDNHHSHGNTVQCLYDEAPKMRPMSGRVTIHEQDGVAVSRIKTAVPTSYRGMQHQIWWTRQKHTTTHHGRQRLRRKGDKPGRVEVRGQEMWDERRV